MVISTPDPGDQRRQLSQRLHEVARLSEGTLPPGSFYMEMLQRLIASLAAVAGSVWILTPHGNLQQQVQINIEATGLDADENFRQSHDALLRLAFTDPKPMQLPPRSILDQPEEGNLAAGNPTSHMLLLVPIRQDEKILGLIEIFQGPNRPAAAAPGYLQYMTLMAEHAGRYERNRAVRP
jgi:transcriptional regulator with GAF, ATPase, and Fis domain